MVEAGDREHWRRAQRTRKWGAFGAGLGLAALAVNAAVRAFIVAKIALSGSELRAAAIEAFSLSWHGVSPSAVYSGHEIWLRDTLGSAIFGALLLIVAAIGILLVRREVGREARLWTRIDQLEDAIANSKNPGTLRSSSRSPPPPQTIERTDRKQWCRRQRMHQSAPVVLGLFAAVCALYLVQNSMVLVRLALEGREACETIRAAFWLDWNSATPTDTYSGYTIWFRDVIGGAIFNAMLLAAVVFGGLAARREFRREERMWAHIESLEAELAQTREERGEDDTKKSGSTEAE